ncbi:MAG: hypothetical protein I8H71_01380 [Xanthomonadaceae bacterium]|nr:hypothetical protein [Xanthomonadaceae bacterium]
MDKAPLRLQAPITVEIKVSITDGNRQQGTATLGMPVGNYPTESEIRERVANFAEKEIPEGFRLMTKREWFTDTVGQAQEVDDDGRIVRMDYAIPGGKDWDA